MDRSFVILQQEGYLFRTCLTAGLTALRTGHVGDKGRLYSAFFQLGIGLERVMKVILILDTVARTGSPPTEKSLKGEYGHDLIALWRSVEQIEPKVPEAEALDRASLDFAILQFLSDFATSERYYNLGALTNKRSSPDPLARWGEILAATLKNDADPRHVAIIEATSRDLGTRMEPFVSTRAAGLDGEEMSMIDVITTTRAHQLASPYAVRRVMTLITTLRQRLIAACQAARSNAVASAKLSIPLMEEFLEFAHPAIKDRLSKRRWD